MMSRTFIQIDVFPGHGRRRERAGLTTENGESSMSDEIEKMTNDELVEAAPPMIIYKVPAMPTTRDLASEDAANPRAYGLVPAATLKFHPLANILPSLDRVRQAELAQDIADHGLLDPITLLDEQILDGRGRYRACEIAKVEPRYVNCEGDDPIAFVVSKNVHRRHLKTGQRALIAERLASLPLGRPRKTPSIDGISQEAAAKLLHVSVTSVERAHAVREHGTVELIAAVEQGQVPVSAGAAIAKKPPAQQADAIHKRARRPRRPPEEIAAEKKAKAESRAAAMALKMGEYHARAEQENRLRDIAAIIFGAPDDIRRRLIEMIKQVSCGVQVSDLALCMREMRPALFTWEDDSDVSEHE